MKFATLEKKPVKKELVTPHHEKWLKEHDDLEYTQEALDFAAGQLSAVGRDRRGSFSASGLGSCPRSQQITFLGLPKNSLRPRQLQVAHNGTFMHLRWQMAGISAGWLAEPEVPIPDNIYGLKGTMDGVLLGGEGLELKSCNVNAYSGIRSFGPKTEHLFQVYTYMLATGISVFSLIYENKDTQDWEEFVIERDEAMIERVKEKAEGLWDKTYTKQLFPMIEKCEYKEGWQYDWCTNRVSCMGMKEWPGEDS